MHRRTIVAAAAAIALALSLSALPSAQGIQAVIGSNTSVVAGVKDQFVGDMFRQRQNEAVSCTFAVNPDQQIFAYNDYRTVDLALDTANVGTPSPIQRSFFAKLFTPLRKPRPSPVVDADHASALAWIGLSFTDNGSDFYTGLHPGSPFSPNIPAAQGLASYGFQAASDPVFAATPTHCVLAGIAFTPGGLSAGFVSRFTSKNNNEKGPNVVLDWSKVLYQSPVTLSGASTSDFFVDKPYVACGANGRCVVAFTVFDDSDPTKLSSKIITLTSPDYGDTWSATPVVVSQPLSRNQSPWILIDPNNENNVYIGWRVFANPQYPSLTNAIVGKRSSDGGATFGPTIPFPVALLLRAYDAPQTVYPSQPITPRSNAYPTAVIDAQGTISVFVQEYIDPSTGYPLSPMLPVTAGKARITQTNSYDRGITWTARRAFDYGADSGPQFMPSAAVTGVPGPACTGRMAGPRSRLAVLYYDARPSYPGGSVFIGGGGARFDVRVAQADSCVTDTGRHPIFGASQQVSRYTLDAQHNIVTTPGLGYPAVNAAYRIFNSVQSFFTGDYIHITPKMAFVLSGSVWKATTNATVNPADLPSPVFKGTWADTRDIRLPTQPGYVGIPLTAGFIDGLPWEQYAPPHSGLPVAACLNPGSRDQNPYMAEISDGLYAAAPITFRNSNAPRAYPVYIENRTSLNRFFRVTITSGNAQFNLPPATPDTQADVSIGKFSSVTGSVLVLAGVTTPVTAAIQEVSALGATGILSGGLSTTVTLNTTGDTSGAQTPTENRTPSISPAPIITKPFGIIGPAGITVGPAGPNPYPVISDTSTFSSNPFGENPFGENPFGENPFGENTQVYDVTDVTFTAYNVGDKASSYSALLNVLNFNVLQQGGYRFQTFINRVSRIPGLNGCQAVEIIKPNQISNIKTPAGANPFGENPFGENPFGENPFGENPFGENPFGENGAPNDAVNSNVSNSTLYLAPTVDPASPTYRDTRPQDYGTYTLRVFQTVPTPAVTFSPSQVSVALVAHEPNVVQAPDGSFVFQTTANGTPLIPFSEAGAQVPTQVAFTTQPVSNVTGSTFSVAVTVADVFQNVVTGYNNPITLTIGNNPSGGTLSGTTSVTPVNGVATFTGLSISKAGADYTLVASTGAVTGTSQKFDVAAPPPPASLTVLNTDFTSAARGAMAARDPIFSDGTGTISLTGVTGTITRALLYWHGPTNSTNPNVNATVTFAGHSVTGANFGIASDNSWGMLNSQTYGADVTWLVHGNGDYSLSNFIKTGNGLIADVNGASLIVFYDDGNASNNRDVFLLSTNDSTWDSPFNWNTTMTGIAYSGGAASLQLHVSDGQGWGDGGLYLNNTNTPFIQAGPNFQGNTVPPTDGATIGFDTVQGGLWDIKTYDIPQGVLTVDGPNSLTLFSPRVNDAISLVVMIVSVPHPAPAVIGLTPAASDDDSRR